jgi:hypothetical protein
VTLNGACSAGGVHTLTVTKNGGAPSMVLNYTTSNTTANTVTNNGFSDFTTTSVTGANTIGHLVLQTTNGLVQAIDYEGRNTANFAPAENVCTFAGVVTGD